MIVGDPMILRSYHIPKKYDEWLKMEARKRQLTAAQLLRDIIKAEMERTRYAE